MTRGERCLVVLAAACWALPAIYLATGVVFLPHQLLLLVVNGVTESIFPVIYFVGGYAGLYVTYALVQTTRGRRPNVRRWSLWVAIVAWASSLAVGPGGMYVLAGIASHGWYEIGGWYEIAFHTLLPLLLGVCLIALNRRVLFGDAVASRETA